MGFLPIKAPRFNRQVILHITKTTKSGVPVLLKTIYGYTNSKQIAFARQVPYGLRVSFQIDRKISANSDTAVIRIWNLNKESRQALAARSLVYDRQRDIHYIQVEAGHTGTLGFDAPTNTKTTGIIFNGGISFAFSERQGPDWITEIQASSIYGQALLNQIDKSWRTTPLRSIITELFAVAGWPGPKFSPQADIELLGKIEGSKSVAGSAYNAAATLIKNNGLAFHVDHDGVTIYAYGYPKDVSVLPVSEDTGMIGTPKVTALGANFKALLDPRIRPGQLVNLTSETLESSIAEIRGNRYVLWGVKITGDTHTDDWFCEAEGWLSPPPTQKNIGAILGPPTTGFGFVAQL